MNEFAVRHVIANRFDGLGGRMIALLFAWSLARRLGAKALVHWPDTRGLSGRSLEDLFAAGEEPPPQSARMQWLDLGRKADFRRIQMIGPYDRIPPDALTGCDTLVLRTTDTAIARDLPGYDETQLLADCRRQAAAWQAAPRVRALLARKSVQVDYSCTVGVHVRRGDLQNHPDPVHRGRLVGLEKYFARLDAGAGDAPILLATDDRRTVRAMRKRYGDRVHSLGTRGFSRRCRRDTEHAFAEMLLLSRCASILGGPSNFCRAAALIGGRPLTMLAPDAPPPDWDRVKGNWGGTP